jgi:hypothetical protein
MEGLMSLHEHPRAYETQEERLDRWKRESAARRVEEARAADEDRELMEASAREHDLYLAKATNKATNDDARMIVRVILSFALLFAGVGIAILAITHGMSPTWD